MATARVICLASILAVAATLGAKASDPFAICKDQIYALCAAARCFVFNDVAYCKCDVEFGDSVGASFASSHNNVCCRRARPAKRLHDSTFSVRRLSSSRAATWPSIPAPHRPRTAPMGNATADSALRARRAAFPGTGRRLTENEIICSCPITVADPSTAKAGYRNRRPISVPGVLPEELQERHGEHQHRKHDLCRRSDWKRRRLIPPVVRARATYRQSIGAILILPHEIHADFLEAHPGEPTPCYGDGGPNGRGGRWESNGGSRRTSLSTCRSRSSNPAESMTKQRGRRRRR